MIREGVNPFEPPRRKKKLPPIASANEYAEDINRENRIAEAQNRRIIKGD